MGRKSLAVERREDILNAFEQCIVERGIEGTSFQHIAQLLGMDRKMISHYFGNREALVDAMTERIASGFTSHVNKVMANLGPLATVMELVDAFYDQVNASEHTDSLWMEICAYATRSEAVRKRLQESYDNMFWSVGKVLKCEYPNLTKEEAQTAVYTISTLLDRSSTFEWIGVKKAPIKLARVAITKVLESLE